MFTPPVKSSRSGRAAGRIGAAGICRRIGRRIEGGPVHPRIAAGYREREGGPPPLLAFAAVSSLIALPNDFTGEASALGAGPSDGAGC